MQADLLDYLGAVLMGETPSFRRGLGRGQRSDFQVAFPQAATIWTEAIAAAIVTGMAQDYSVIKV